MVHDIRLKYVFINRKKQGLTNERAIVDDFLGLPYRVKTIASKRNTGPYLLSSSTHVFHIAWETTIKFFNFPDLVKHNVAHKLNLCVCVVLVLFSVTFSLMLLNYPYDQ